MLKVDLKKELAHLYRPSAKEVSLVEVPRMNYLMIDGSGAPESSAEFQEAVGALYAVAYTLKFRLKKSGERPEFTVMPLEGLWWMEGVEGFDADNAEAWQWTLMIMQPGFVTEEDVRTAVSECREKKNPPGLERIRFESLSEGTAVQIMHVGPYDQEGPAIEKLHSFARENGYELSGRHHEIYLGDPRRIAPERLKTIIRHPVS